MYKQLNYLPDKFPITAMDKVCDTVTTELVHYGQTVFRWGRGVWMSVGRYVVLGQLKHICVSAVPPRPPPFLFLLLEPRSLWAT